MVDLGDCLTQRERKVQVLAGNGFTLSEKQVRRLAILRGPISHM
ncbi:hypothetical protein QTI33_33080 [Variovorax sp. J22P271]|nr:hypothetical protein [Variovorax sp. J22P271]MDM0037009.1 hypothetical protein [Variovorax sp. J22P271]